MRYYSNLALIITVLTFFAGINSSTSYAQVASDSTNTMSQAKVKTFSGRVTDILSQPISGATVIILSKSNKLQAKTANRDSSLFKTKTDTNGKFKIKNIAPGTYTVKVEADDYEASKQTIQITKDKRVIFKLELT